MINMLMHANFLIQNLEHSRSLQMLGIISAVDVIIITIIQKFKKHNVEPQES